ncbi:Kinetochore protein Sos7 [Schizosaccharomyces pombe]|uniref:Outer kinetochore KNL1 complex subunit sos7 n=1 Tax=Schizosaccharomyces pombe (strain 972 / ATCC 24843) TaxID=284812 RepID=ZWINT_SCHPO|nr:protein sos7 [Schizosaccharomyces pombe]U3H042.1 RecName: Full=Kinetochore protein Sos7; AltName: Full=Suppressor of spc7 protein [Schizosaccharomyces pombe 972h-]CAO77638.2 Bfr1 binding protein ortholog Sos7 [Schizosaccharomyces pombe]|eukprot:NP_001343031.1 protein sos7 [Schizosaccharomyces pombe]
MDQNKSTQATGNGKKTEEINELLESFIKEGPKLLWGSTNLKYEDQISRSSEHELQQYRELFTRLKFSYIEQGTKERYLRAILDDPPMLVEAEDNEKLETTNSSLKGRLKSEKREVDLLTEELKTTSRELSSNYESVMEECKNTKSTLSKLESLESELLKLQQDSSTKTPILPEVEAAIHDLESELNITNESIETIDGKIDNDEKYFIQLTKNLSLLEKEYKIASERSNQIKAAIHTRTPDADAKKQVQNWYTSMLEIYDQLLQK